MLHDFGNADQSFNDDFAHQVFYTGVEPVALHHETGGVAAPVLDLALVVGFVCGFRSHLFEERRKTHHPA